MRVVFPFLLIGLACAGHVHRPVRQANFNEELQWAEGTGMDSPARMGRPVQALAMILLALRNPASGWQACGCCSRIARGHRVSPRSEIGMTLSGKQSDMDLSPLFESRRQLLMALPTLFLLPLSASAKFDTLGTPFLYSKPTDEAIADIVSAIKIFNSTKIPAFDPDAEPTTLEKITKVFAGKEKPVNRDLRLFQNFNIGDKTVDGDTTSFTVSFEDAFTGYSEFLEFTFSNGECKVKEKKGVDFSETGYDIKRYNLLAQYLSEQQGWKTVPIET
mmetsp:Transcript_129563/g.242400  ORF Transcript_129563/g.242400 Transcript_129563/m.242400 type:complete len:275 (-) Transcript_129563:40-864(-)